MDLLHVVYFDHSYSSVRGVTRRCQETVNKSLRINQPGIACVEALLVKLSTPDPAQIVLWGCGRGRRAYRLVGKGFGCGLSQLQPPKHGSRTRTVDRRALEQA